MFCPRCRRHNDDCAGACAHCGAPLVARCPACGTELPPGSRFCLNCGQRLAAAAPEDDLGRVHPGSVAPEPLTAGEIPSPRVGEKRPITLLLVQVVGLPAPAGQTSPQAAPRLDAELSRRMAAEIRHFQGTVARVEGDGLWAVFGAPVAHEDDPVRAVRAGLGVLDVARQFGEEAPAAPESVGGPTLQSGQAGRSRSEDVDSRLRGNDEGLRGNDGGSAGDLCPSSDLRPSTSLVRACVHTTSVETDPLSAGLWNDPAAGVLSRAGLAAEPMSVLITEPTYRLVAPLFDCAGRETLEAPGAALHLKLYEVRGARAEPGRLRGLTGLESPMVGRDLELETLLHLHDAVRAGVGRAVLIVGEPGLGKTRLIAEWHAALRRAPHGRDLAWFEGRCLSYGQGLAYHLLIDLLRAIIGAPESAGEPAARAALDDLVRNLFGSVQGGAAEVDALDVFPFLAHLLSLRLEGEALDRVGRLDPQALQAQTLSALQKLLLALSARRPLAIVLEDIHWADPSSVAVLTRLLPLASTAPILFCLAARPDRDAPGWRLVTTARESLRGSLTEIELGPLSESDGRRMVAHLLHLEALPEQVRSLILSKADGNPFFVEEVIRMLIDRGAIVSRDGGWWAADGIETVEIPDNLQGLLVSRIDQLPEEARLALRVAAVIGRQFPLRVLRHVLHEGDRPWA